MWVPDVYQGAPTAATLLVAGAPKLAAFAITIRLLVEGLINTATDWQQMLMILAVLSMTIGNLAAIAQTNLKRMLAYSGIAQLGFMLLGFVPSVVSGNTVSAGNGYGSSLFYILIYVLTTGYLRLDHAVGSPWFRVGADFRSGWFEQAQSFAGWCHGGVHVLAGRYSSYGGLLRQAGSAARR